ncbi:ABC transporter permease [Arthrobacter sp. H35-D1]|uniref:ABC transporter permease n=1 Tax=Arthrobacter sp. H35-D1 TaxID=3046202 RepID=UPI0024B8E781|nr:ABC transporter permease [Arthrobacter sp. H35-D1]MDJ0312255.1 ABC transporter permease [Arthrobacter sp. H35-D1]
MSSTEENPNTHPPGGDLRTVDEPGKDPAPGTEKAGTDKTSTGKASGAEDPAVAEAAARKRAKAETIGRYTAMFLMPLIMVGMMVGGYLAAMHSPTPNNMPVVVAGAPAAAAEFAQALEPADPDAVDVRTVATAEEAQRLVVDRDVAGAVVLGEGNASLYTAGAAGASQAGAVTGLLAPQIMAQGYELTAEDLAPLPESDKSGLGAMFMTTALIMAGYLPFSLTLSNSPELLRFRRAVPLLAGWAALAAGLVWAVTGPVLGVVQGPAWAVLGICWLGVFAVGAVQLLLTRLLGPLAIIAAMFLLMVLGVPASNMGMSVYTMPDLYAFLHSFLPTPALGEALRSVMYFDGAGTGPYLLVLAVGAALALLLTLGFDANKRRKNPNAAPPVVAVQSLHGGPRPKTRFWRYAALLFFPFAMVAMMISFMLGAMFEPTPHDMPVAVVGATADAGQEAVDRLDSGMQGLFELSAVDSEQEARTLVGDRTVTAALVLPSEQNSSALLLTNEAGSSSAQQLVSTLFGQVAASENMELETENVAPLPGSDSAGTVALYMAMGWMMAGFLIIVVGANAAPASRPLRKLLPIVAAWSLFMSAVLYLIAGPMVGAIDGHFWALFGTGAVAIFAAAMVATVFERLIGMLSILPVVAILMFLGVPSSGGALSIYMQPEAFRVLHDILPMPAAVEATRSILYFGGDVVAGALLNFAIWGAVSLGVVAVIDRFKPVGGNETVPHGGAPAEPDAEPLAQPAEQKELVTL